MPFSTIDEEIKSGLQLASRDDLKRIHFIMEMDKMKSIYRQSLLLDRSRTETDAEHSWQLTLMAVVLSSHADESVDMMKVMKMCLLHDVVEIDAGDTFAYDVEGYKTKANREMKAANRIFAILPKEQGDEFKNLWLEFDANESPEAKFANALDRLQPILIHIFTEGHNWKNHHVELEAVQKRVAPIRESLPEIWPVVEEALSKAFDLDLLK